MSRFAMFSSELVCALIDIIPTNYDGG